MQVWSVVFGKPIFNTKIATKKCFVIYFNFKRVSLDYNFYYQLVKNFLINVYHWVCLIFEFEMGQITHRFNCCQMTKNSGLIDDSSI